MPTPTKPTRRWPRYFRRLCVAAFVLMLGYGVLATSHDLVLGQWQDKCAFGSVSNAQYRKWKEMAAERVVAPTSQSLNTLFDLLAKDITTIDERLAIGHAVMRAHGFTFHKFSVGWERAPWAGNITFGYKKFQVGGLKFGCFYGCQDYADLEYGLGARYARAKPDQFVLTYYPIVVDGSAPHHIFGRLGLCPPVPNAAETEQLRKILGQ